MLVVEDDELIRDSFAATLRDEGFSVRTARDGEQGLAEARAHPPGVIILDMLMPVMNGWAFLKVVAADPMLASIPVVQSSAVVERRHPPAVANLPKPVDYGELVDLVRAFLPAPAPASGK